MNAIQVPIEVTKESIEDLFITAVETGINYWAASVHADGSSEYDYVGRKLTIVEVVEPGDFSQDCTHILDLTQDDLPPVVKGLQLMSKLAPAHFADFISGDIDATTADVFVQMILFGEIRYA